MNEEDLKRKVRELDSAAERAADRLAAAGIKSPWGWCIYAAFLAAGFVLGKLL